LRILQVSSADAGGGAETVARQLFDTYRTLGHWSRLAVGIKHLDDPDIIALGRPGEGGLVESVARRIGGERLARNARDPGGMLARLRGSEAVNAPSSWTLLERLGPDPPDLLHCHNLHGASYFDLRALPSLSQKVPLVLTLHDAWLLSGHCAHSLDCNRWLTGCGHCPDLSLYPAIRRDNTAANFAAKRGVFTRTRAFISAPSAWLLGRARGSHLANAIVESRVMPNGVDTEIFAPLDRRLARAGLQIGESARVLLFVAARGAANQWKDFPTLRGALQRIGASEGEPIVCLVLGAAGAVERFGRIAFRPLPPEADPGCVARLYAAADVYVHATRADTFPLSVLEALACGTPVVASAIGGIPEQLNHLVVPGLPQVPGVAGTSRESATGILVPAAEPNALATAVLALIDDRRLAAQLGENARREALRRFELNAIVRRWLAWYEEIVNFGLSGAS
jgi:glycosyltransferase involved in cell wall biosynthesis